MLLFPAMKPQDEPPAKGTCSHLDSHHIVAVFNSSCMATPFFSLAHNIFTVFSLNATAFIFLFQTTESTFWYSGYPKGRIIKSTFRPEIFVPVTLFCVVLNTCHLILFLLLQLLPVFEILRFAVEVAVLSTCSFFSFLAPN